MLIGNVMEILMMFFFVQTFWGIIYLKDEVHIFKSMIKSLRQFLSAINSEALFEYVCVYIY